MQTSREYLKVFADKLAGDLNLNPTGPWLIPEDCPLPSGRERGTVFVVDVGGSTCRISQVSIDKGSHRQRLTSILLDSGAKQDIVAHVVGLLGSVNARGDVALGWAFPLVEGRIQALGKGFSNTYVGQSIDKLFNEALDAAGLACRITQVCQDGTAGLLASMYRENRVRIALTWGTGLNISFLAPNGQIVNAEASMIGREGYGQIDALKHDRISDFQPLESIVGGLYLAESASRLAGSQVDFWPAFRNPEHQFHEIAQSVCERAAALVGTVVGVFARHVGDPIYVSYSGGVICEPGMLERTSRYASALAKIEFVEETYGSEIGTAIRALLN